MMDEAFWLKAYSCLTCGKPHEYRKINTHLLPHSYTWADPEDGHHYRTIIPIDMLRKLREYVESA